MSHGDSMRNCKAYLRRRLEHGPPGAGVVERAESSAEAAEEGGTGSSGWSHLWPLGRHKQCEELRRVRDSSRTISVCSPLLGWVGLGLLSLCLLPHSPAQLVDFEIHCCRLCIPRISFFKFQKSCVQQYYQYLLYSFRKYYNVVFSSTPDTYIYTSASVACRWGLEIEQPVQ